MRSPLPLAEAVAAEAVGFADRLDTIDPAGRGASTPCADWTIDDLANHVAVGMVRDAEAFHRARFGVPSPPGEVMLGGADPALVVRAAVEHLLDAVIRGPQTWPTVPLPFGPYPVTAALQSLIVEFGVHRNDLEVATGQRIPPFSDATRTALFGFGEHYLLRQAAPLEASACAFTLAAPSATLSITWNGGRWVRGADAARECRIAGSDDAVARLMLRRLDITDPRIDLLDPHHLAPLFPCAIRPL
ncbi:maleylpyruvate isomerase family mycothiol-dependent enzyme [Mycobacterium manitobense]|uniref:Maleylpyruvate isomerase family mycothiol-dependent enzyme n=1 Tax=[Mycobacterium] manitobense TaxID=190147 RepID=A0A9X3BRD6_9MYCO|nr:maleylpyruvate isomerase family mycothiol-dependent enzyme [[Mycobacterium] manitobense]MCV7174060.1 maleylpyruvate isomerase family mycothiol-dependent enzyme [[Mycobacterium] manitobense]